MSHRWDNHVAFITDENNQVIENQEVNKKIWYQESQKNFTENFETPAGQTARSILVFDVPNTIQKPYLQVRGATLMGDFFDGNQFLKVKVRLF